MQKWNANMKGRPAKDTNTHKRQGTFTKTRHAERAEQPPVDGLPAPPADFTDRHRYWWAHFIKNIKSFAVLTEPHLNAIALLCRLTVEREILDAEIQAYGHTVKTKAGMVRINPAFSARMDVDKQIIKLYEQFGFTLRASMNLKVEKPKQASTILELMAGGKKKVV